MSNFEKYKEFMIKIYNGYIEQGFEDDIAIAKALIRIHKIYDDTNKDLFGWLFNYFKVMSDEELKETVLDYTDDLKYKIEDIKLSLVEMLNKIKDLEERIKEWIK